MDLKQLTDILTMFGIPFANWGNDPANPHARTVDDLLRLINDGFAKLEISEQGLSIASHEIHLYITREDQEGTFINAQEILPNGKVIDYGPEIYLPGFSVKLNGNPISEVWNRIIKGLGLQGKRDYWINKIPKEDIPFPITPKSPFPGLNLSLTVSDDWYALTFRIGAEVEEEYSFPHTDGRRSVWRWKKK